MCHIYNGDGKATIQFVLGKASLSALEAKVKLVKKRNPCYQLIVLISVVAMVTVTPVRTWEKAVIEHWKTIIVYSLLSCCSVVNIAFESRSKRLGKSSIWQVLNYVLNLKPKPDGLFIANPYFRSLARYKLFVVNYLCTI